MHRPSDPLSRVLRRAMIVPVLVLGLLATAGPAAAEPPPWSTAGGNALSGDDFPPGQIDKPYGVGNGRKVH